MSANKDMLILGEKKKPATLENEFSFYLFTFKYLMLLSVIIWRCTSLVFGWKNLDRR